MNFLSEDVTVSKKLTLSRNTDKGKVCYLQFLSGKVAVKMEDGKTKEFPKNDIEMVDADVNVEIDVPVINTYTEDNDNIDIRQLEDDRNSSTGNV